MTLQENKLRYTLGFIHCPETNQILLLNRQKKPWMGRWNGVGGKLEENESPYDCIVRETEEETGLKLPQYKSRGVLTWNIQGTAAFKGESIGGMYLFTAQVSEDVVKGYPTPIEFDNEGILAWKNFDWCSNKDNLGIVDNIKIIFEHIFEGCAQDLYTTKYQGDDMISFVYYPKAGERSELSGC